MEEVGAAFPPQMVTPVKMIEHPMKRPPEWDHSYSDGSK